MAPSPRRLIRLLREGGRRRRRLRESLFELTESLVAQSEGCAPGVPGHGRRVADMASTLAEAAARDGAFSSADLPGPEERASMTLASLIHGVADPVSERLALAPALPPEALAALAYRLRWIREICRHRALLRSVADGGGFFPPCDPEGLPPGDYAVRAREVDDVLDFLESIQESGAVTREQKERLASLARRRLAREDGPPIPYVSETEYEALAGSGITRRAEMLGRLNEARNRLLEHLDGLRWPDALRPVPRMVAVLLDRGDPGSRLSRRILRLAHGWDTLQRWGASGDRPLPADEVLPRLRKEAEEGRQDPEMVGVLERRGLLPTRTASAESPPEASESPSPDPSVFH